MSHSATFSISTSTSKSVCKEGVVDNQSVSLSASHRPTSVAHLTSVRDVYPAMRARKVPVVRSLPNSTASMPETAAMVATTDGPVRDTYPLPAGTKVSHPLKPELSVTTTLEKATKWRAMGQPNPLQHPARKHPLNAGHCTDHFTTADVLPGRVTVQHSGIVMRRSRGSSSAQLKDSSRSGQVFKERGVVCNVTDDVAQITRLEESRNTMHRNGLGPGPDPRPDVDTAMNTSFDSIAHYAAPPLPLSRDDIALSRGFQTSGPSFITSSVIIPVSNAPAKIGAPPPSSFLQLEIDSDGDEDW